MSDQRQEESAPVEQKPPGSAAYKFAALALFVLGTVIAVWLAWSGWESIQSCSTLPFDAAHCGNGGGGYGAIVAALFLIVVTWGAAGKVWNRD